MTVAQAGPELRLLPLNWMRLGIIELRSLYQVLDGERARWQEDRQTFAKEGFTDKDKEYREIQNIIADYNIALNALKAIIRQKVEGESV